MYEGKQVLRFENNYKSKDLYNIGNEMQDRIGTGNYDPERTKFNLHFKDIEKYNLYQEVKYQLESRNIEYLHKNKTNLLKYAQKEQEFDFVCGDIINRANLFCTPTQLGRLINSNLDYLKINGLHLIQKRTSEGRKYFAKYIEPKQELDVEEE